MSRRVDFFRDGWHMSSHLRKRKRISDVGCECTPNINGMLKACRWVLCLLDRACLTVAS